jgi:hypothetical protein
MIEQKRGCGFRKEGGLYLVGGTLSAPCDRLPFPLTACPVCGAGFHMFRGIKAIIPDQLFGIHGDPLCRDVVRPCAVCDPTTEPAYVIQVGDGYYKKPSDFLNEAALLGVSRRIPSIPRKLVIGKTWIYLAHKKACTVEKTPTLQYANLPEGTTQPRLLEAPVKTLQFGIFAAFRPIRIEKIVNQSAMKDKEMLKDLEKRGITPIPVPDNDVDHH